MKVLRGIQDFSTDQLPHITRARAMVQTGEMEQSIPISYS